MTFQEFGLDEPILRTPTDQGCEQPFPIQVKAILPMLTGQDVLGCARTDTGKTCVSAVPILQQLSGHKAQGRPIRAPILTPTQELVLQVQESLEAYGKYLSSRSTVIFGGVGRAPQVERPRKGVDILVATPGRLGGLYDQKFINLPRLGTFTLDEIDRMLGMGFIHNVCRVLGWLLVQRQTLFFLATMPPEVQGLVGSLLHGLAKMAVNPIFFPIEVINQKFYHVDHGNKIRLLTILIRELDVKNALVFTRIKRGTNKVAGDLVKTGTFTTATHGNKSQAARQQTLADSKGGAMQVLVATDIAAQGLGIEGLSHVFNYNLPDVPGIYVHRIGRIDRTGRGGTTISFCDISEEDELRAIEKLIGRAIPVMEGHPWPMEVLEPLSRDKKGRMINPGDTEARAVAKGHRRWRDAANKVATEARKAKTDQKILEQPPQPEPARETSAKKCRRQGQRNSAILEEALTTTAPTWSVQMGFANFHKPDPPASDAIVDATTRLLTPRGRAQAAPRKDKPVEQPAKKRKKAARPPEPPAKPEPQAAWERKGSGHHGGRGRPSEVTLRTNRQKDSTGQSSLMKPYYPSHD